VQTHIPATSFLAQFFGNQRERGAMDEPPGLVNLRPLMSLGSDRPEIKIGLIDGPVELNSPNLVRERIRKVPGKIPGVCGAANRAACIHGTFVAGILCARRNSSAPAICSGCTLVRPIFAETGAADGEMPSATAEELALLF